MKYKILLALTLLIILGGCVSVQDNNGEILVRVNKKELYEMTYEWALYKEIAILEYAKIHNVSKEVSRKHLEEAVHDAAEKNFIAMVENERKWGIKE